MTIANIHDAKTNLSKLIKQVLNGEKVVIAKAGNPIVEMNIYKDTQTPTKKNKRVLGMLKGKMWVSPDAFSKETDQEIADLFNNGSIWPS